jgi:hypothetical protein
MALMEDLSVYDLEVSDCFTKVTQRLCCKTGMRV